MTMIELLVAVAILSIMILSFAAILTQAQRVVSGTEKSIRAKAAAGAMAQVFRDDLRRATRHGLLCITQDADGGPPRLIVTTAGVTPSKVHAQTGTGSLCQYGLAVNQSATTSPPVLYAQRWVLRKGAVPIPPTDLLDYDLANIQALPRGGTVLPEWDMDRLVSQMVNSAPPNNITTPGQFIRIPAETLSDLAALWQVLQDGCEWVSITWTDGTKDDNVPPGPPGDPTDDFLRWFGVEYEEGTGYIAYGKDATGKPDEDIWKGVAFDPNLLTQIEFNAGANVYRALWTHHNQNNWPKAIRIRFKLVEQDGPYELICPVDR